MHKALLATTLGSAVGLSLAVAATPAAAEPVPIITGAPTSERSLRTADDSALFELRSAPWPGRNECRLDRTEYKPCSFFFEAKGLSQGPHRLDVRQYDQDGNVSQDFWVWRVAPAFIDVEPHTYCYLGVKDKEEEGFRWRDGRALYRSFVPGTAAQATWPNLETYWFPPNGAPLETAPTEEDIFNDAEASYGLSNPAWLNEFLTVPTLFDNRWQAVTVSRFGGSKAPNTFPAGEGSPFGMQAGPAVGEFPRESKYRTGWELGSPGKSAGAIKQTAFSAVRFDTAACLALLPPVAVTDNGDGTLSATFGWANLSPWTIKAPAGAPSDTAAQNMDRNGVIKLAGNQVSDLGGVFETPKGMPTQFGANSQGTWTYTFDNPGTDSDALISWDVGFQQASLAIRQSQVTPATPPNGGITPFTHVDPSTTQQPPARPLATDTTTQGKQIVPPPVDPAKSGGVVDSRTTLKVKNKILRPKSKKVKVGKKIRFKVTIRNTGTVDAMTPRLCNALPRGTKLVSAPHHRQRKGNRVCWNGSRLAGGAAVTGKMTLKVKKNAKAGKRVDRARVKAANSFRAVKKVKFRIVK